MTKSRGNKSHEGDEKLNKDSVRNLKRRDY
jgi:hypothetical protein